MRVAGIDIAFRAGRFPHTLECLVGVLVMKQRKLRLCRHCGETDESKFSPKRATECRVCEKERKLVWKRKKNAQNPCVAACKRCGVAFKKRGPAQHCRDCVPKHKSELDTKRSMEWNRTNKERRREIANKYARDQIENLGDSYVLACMTQSGKGRELIPKPLLEAYRSNMKLKRQIKEITT